MNSMKNFIPEVLVNEIIDFVVCDCGWTKNHEDTHEYHSDKECDKIDWSKIICYDCEEQLNKNSTYIDIKSRCTNCHIENITEPVYGARKGTFIDYEMAGGSRNWWNYRVYFDDDGEQTNVCKISAHGEQSLNDALCYYDDPNKVILESEIPEELRENFTEIDDYNY